MSEADKAFERAKAKRIARLVILQAKKSGAKELDFGWHPELNYLDDIPSEIKLLSELQSLSLQRTSVWDISILGNLTSLRILNLKGTRVTNLTPLRSLPALQGLDLRGTQVTDLAPLRDLPRLTGVGTFENGLFFSGIPATQSDPELARLSEIKDNAERTQQTLAYLREQAAKDQPEPPADQPAAPHYVLGEDGRLRSEEVAPGQWDAEQAELQQDLVGKAASLAGLTAGRNEPQVIALHQQAEAYRRIISRNSPDLPLKRLWSAANALRASYEGSQASEEEARLNDVLPPLIAAALRDLVETHGLFIMGFPEAREIEAMIRGYLTGVRNPDALAEGQAILEQLHDEGVLPEEEFATAKLDAMVAGGAGPSAEMGEISFLARVDNMILAISRRLRSAVKYSGHAVTSGVIGNTAYAWIVGNQSLVASFLEKTLGDISYWFPKLIDAARAVFGA